LEFSIRAGSELVDARELRIAWRLKAWRNGFNWSDRLSELGLS
jgi:hypothetical protein